VWACRSGLVNIVSALLDNGADVMQLPRKLVLPQVTAAKNVLCMRRFVICMQGKFGALPLHSRILSIRICVLTCAVVLLVA
jgi:ankyrin repeat protein